MQIQKHTNASKRNSRPQLVFMSGLVCNKPILQRIMNLLGGFGDVHFIDYFSSSMNSMEKICQATHATISGLDPHRPIVLITFSLGGYVSPLLLEKMHSEGTASRISAVCGIESTPYADLPERQEQRDELLQMIKDGRFRDVVNIVVTRDWYLPDIVESRPDIVEESKEMIMNLGPEVFAAQTLAIRNRQDVTKQLRYFTMPTLTISAERSNLFRKSDPRYGKTPVEALREGIPAENHKVVLIPGAGHLVPRTHAEIVAGNIGNFLCDHKLLCLPSETSFEQVMDDERLEEGDAWRAQQPSISLAVETLSLDAADTLRPQPSVVSGHTSAELEGERDTGKSRFASREPASDRLIAKSPFWSKVTDHQQTAKCLRENLDESLHIYSTNPML